MNSVPERMEFNTGLAFFKQADTKESLFRHLSILTSFFLSVCPYVRWSVCLFLNCIFINMTLQFMRWIHAMNGTEHYQILQPSTRSNISLGCTCNAQFKRRVQQCFNNIFFMFKTSKYILAWKLAAQTKDKNNHKKPSNNKRNRSRQLYKFFLSSKNY